MEFWQAIIISVGTGGFSAALTVAALKTDVKWLSASLNRAHKRIDAVESDIKAILGAR